MRYELNIATGELVELPDLPPNPAPVLTPQERLAKLDADNMLSQRALRETILMLAEGFKQATGGALDLYALPGVQDVVRVEAEAAQIRAEL